MNGHYVTLKRYKLSTIIARILGIGFIGFLILTVLFPIWWIIATSFKTLPESLAYPPAVFPKQFTLSPYKEVVFSAGIWWYFRNSLIYACIGSFISVFFASMSGYAFGKFHFRGRNILFLVVLMTMMIPLQVTLIPSFLLLKQLKWVNTFYGLIIPTLGNAFGIFLIRQFSLGIPNSLFDAARIDGAGEFQMYLKIFLPLSTAVIGTNLVLEFMGRWNDLYWPLIVASEPKVRTLQLALTNLTGSKYQKYWNQIAASMVVAMIPVFTLYTFFQRYFTQGIVMSGIKE